MLKLTINRKVSGDAIPAQLTTLSVSWLNRQFKAVAVHRGVIAGTWEHPGEAEFTGNFDELLREAVQKTGYTGVNVSLLLTYPRLVQQVVDLPPAKGALLDKLVARQAQQQKFFTGEAAWAYEPAVSSKTSQRVILHLIPRSLLDQFVESCRRNDLHLTSVMPPSVVLQQQIPRLPLEKGEAVLLAAETGGSTTVVIGQGDGQVLLARTLPGNWNENAERLALDLNRTILFANEKYGVALHQGVWIFGQGAQTQAGIIDSNMQISVRISPLEYNPLYWAAEAPKLRSPPSPNFISSRLQKAPQRRVFARVVAACTAIIVAASLGASAFFLIRARQEKRNLAVVASQFARLESKRNELQRVDAELSRKKRVVQLVSGDRPPPAPAWLLAYLSEAVPSDLVVTNLQVKREEGFWKVKLAGTPQQGVKHPDAQPVSYSVALLKSRLAGPPFHLEMSAPEDKADKAADEKSAAAASGLALPVWLNRVAGSLTRKDAQAKPELQNHFEIEGVMR